MPLQLTTRARPGSREIVRMAWTWSVRPRLSASDLTYDRVKGVCAPCKVASRRCGVGYCCCAIVTLRV